MAIKIKGQEGESCPVKESARRGREGPWNDEKDTV